MTDEQQIFIKLLSVATLNKSNLEIDCDIDKLKKLAMAHYCASLVSYAASLCSINLTKEWVDAASVTLFNNYRNLAVQNNVLQILKENNIDCVVIKGITAAVNYFNPNSRALGDIDILVKEEDYEKALKIFNVSSNNNSHKFHNHFSLNGVSVEIHKAIDDYETCLNGKEISAYMSHALDEIQHIEFEGFIIPTLSLKYQALVYLNHMVRHFNNNELSMRMFCDWVSYVNKLSKREWENEIYPLIQKCGFSAFADAINLTSEKYMGCSFPFSVSNIISEETIDCLMEEFVFRGTEEVSSLIDGNIASSYSGNSSEGKSFFMKNVNLLNTISRRRFKISRYKILLPFCWMYIVAGYLTNVVKGKRDRLSFRNINFIVERRNFVKNELKLK